MITYQSKRTQNVILHDQSTIISIIMSKKLFKMQVHNSYRLNFIFICQKSLPDDQSTIMQSETFLLRFYSIRNSIILMGIVLGGKASSVSLEKVNDVNIFSNNMYYYVKHNLGQCPKDCKKST